MGLFEVLFGDKIKFADKDENQLIFVRVEDNGVVCHLIHKRSQGDIESSIVRKPFDSIPIDELKRIGAWDKLGSEKQAQLQIQKEQEKEVVAEKMAHARSKRRNKFENLPEFLECKCGNKVKANYSYLQKKADEKKIPLQDLINGYQCQTCNPTKGRRKKK